MGIIILKNPLHQLLIDAASGSSEQAIAASQKALGELQEASNYAITHPGPFVRHLAISNPRKTN